MLRLRFLDSEHPTLLILSREREPKERSGVCASARRHESGRLPEEASGIGAQLDEEIVDRFVKGLPEAEDAHVRDPEGHLVRVIDRLHIEPVLTEHRNEIVRPNEQHLLLAVMAGHDPRLMAVEDLGHHIGELILRWGELDR